MLTTRVSASSVELVGSRPRMIVRPVMNPMTSTAGIVRLMLDSAVPSARLMERCSRLAMAARTAAIDSGDRVSTRTHKPPAAARRVGGQEQHPTQQAAERRRRAEHADAVVDRCRDLLGQKNDGEDVGEQ